MAILGANDAILYDQAYTDNVKYFSQVYPISLMIVK